MTVQQIIDLSKNGELSQLALKDNNGVMLGYLNLALLELYKRFQLKTEEYLIALQDNTTVYDLPSDCMWIVAAYGEVEETSTNTVEVLPINKEDDPMSVNIIGWNRIEVPVVVTGAYISIIYVAAPSMFTEADLEEVVPVPPQMYDLVLDYIAYRATSTIDQGAQSEDNVHYIRFEEGCKKVLYKGMVNHDDMFMSDRIKTKGFV